MKVKAIIQHIQYEEKEIEIDDKFKPLRRWEPGYEDLEKEAMKTIKEQLGYSFNFDAEDHIHWVENMDGEIMMEAY